MNIDRKLATVRKIDDIYPIPDADMIEVAVLDGWKVVVKKNEFKVGDQVVYIEIDSWVPTALAPFLSKNKSPNIYQNISGERLRTVKLRKQISQGLILPLSVIPNNVIIIEGMDLTNLLGIIKWEPPIPACLAGEVFGMFPSFIPKTDQERIQNLEFSEYIDDVYEVTEKLDGSSCTMYFNNGAFGVCSRNLDLKPNDNNSFWRVAKLYQVEEKLRAIGKNLAIQGELIGLGIQGNPYKLEKQEFYVFDVYDIDQGTYLTSKDRCDLIMDMRLNHVPIVVDRLNPRVVQYDRNIILKFAENTSKLESSTQMEGLVFKSVNDPSRSFKAISNRYLMNS